MKINLGCLTELGSHKSIKKQIELPDLINGYQEIETPFPLQINLDIYNTKDSFLLTGELTGRLLLTCSRCLDKFSFELRVSINEELLKSEIPDLENIDLSNIIVEHILLEIPMKTVCRGNCQGLCPLCGRNLNHAQCDCNRETFDPRLLKLKDFFSRDDD